MKPFGRVENDADLTAKPLMTPDFKKLSNVLRNDDIK